MESLVTVSALDSCSFSLTAETDELFSMDQVLESFADIDPLFALNAEFGVLIELDAVLMEEKW